MAFDAMSQRQIMGRFATGVTVITTRFGDEVSGMTANAVISFLSIRRWWLSASIGAPVCTLFEPRWLLCY